MASTSDVFTPVVATANDLRSGAVVFLTAAATWTGDIAQAVVADDPQAAAALLDAAQRDHLTCRVVEPVLIEIRRVAGRIEPTSLRERIRADGPTIDPLVDVLPVP